MSNPVVVSLDGSERDARSLAVAAALAGLADAELRLVRVFDTPPEGLAWRAAALGVASAADQLRDETRHALATTAESLAAEIGRPVAFELLEGADVPGVLTRYAAEREARLVVMATRAAGPAGRALGGSVADRVMRESTRPVVLVPPSADRLRDRQVRIARVLVPLDGSALAARSVDYLLALPGAERLAYVLVEVVAPSNDDAARAAAAGRLGDLAARVRARGAAVEVAVLEAGVPAEAIVGAVRETLVDLIAMSTRGTGGLRRMVLGSVAEGVVRASEVPVMLLTPADLEPDGGP